MLSNMTSACEIGLMSILIATVVPTKSDSDALFCLQLLSKTFTCTLQFSLRESIDHLCINPIHWIVLLHKLSIDSNSLVSL